MQNRDEQNSEGHHALFQRHLASLKTLLSNARRDTRNTQYQVHFLEQSGQNLEALRVSYCNAVTSKTQATSPTYAGYINSIEDMKQTSKPLIFWLFVSVPFLLGILTVSEVSELNDAYFWGISLQGLNHATFMQGLFFVLVYFMARYLWQVVQLKFSYPDQVNFLSFFPISGKNLEEIHMASDAMYLISEIADFCDTYDGAQATNVIHPHFGGLVHDSQRFVDKALDDIAEEADEGLDELGKYHRMLLLSDFFKYNLPLFALTCLSIYCLYSVAQLAFIKT